MIVNYRNLEMESHGKTQWTKVGIFLILHVQLTKMPHSVFKPQTLSCGKMRKTSKTLI